MQGVLLIILQATCPLQPSMQSERRSKIRDVSRNAKCHLGPLHAHSSRASRVSGEVKTSKEMNGDPDYFQGGTSGNHGLW